MIKFGKLTYVYTLVNSLYVVSEFKSKFHLPLAHKLLREKGTRYYLLFICF